MAQAMVKFCVCVLLLLMVVVVAEGAAKKPKKVKCKDKKYPSCYHKNLYCPASCLRTCVVDCASCKPVCTPPPPPPPLHHRHRPKGVVHLLLLLILHLLLHLLLPLFILPLRPLLPLPRLSHPRHLLLSPPHLFPHRHLLLLFPLHLFHLRHPLLHLSHHPQDQRESSARTSTTLTAMAWSSTVLVPVRIDVRLTVSPAVLFAVSFCIPHLHLWNYMTFCFFTSV